MKLLFDVGNTRIKWMLADGGEAEDAGALLLDELSALFATLDERLKGVSVTSVALACVATPDVEKKISNWAQQRFGVAVVVARVQRHFAGVEVAYQELSHLGVDRWLAMLGAWSLRPSAAIVIDAGSAITVDYLSAHGQHEGGLIVPGLNLMRKALYQNTSSVKVPALGLPAEWEPGVDTMPCVANGLAAMASGFLSAVVQKRSGANVILTGGDADALLPYFDVSVESRPQLVLEGLMCVS